MIYRHCFSTLFDYAIRRVQVKQDGFKLNSTHQLLVYADDVNILGESIRIIKENAEALEVASKETGLEVNSDKTTYMIMSGDLNAGRIHSISIDNNSFEGVEEFEYLGIALRSQNSIQEEIKCRLKSGNPKYHSVQNVSSSSLLYENTKVKIYRSIILPVDCMGLKLGRSH